MKCVNVKILMPIILLMLPIVLSAQTDRDYIRKGNAAFRNKNYPVSEVLYRKALAQNSENPQALYNLGCALMMQKNSSEAVKYYQKATSVEKNKLRRARSFHNIGVICQTGKMYDDAIKAYAEALRNNPHDDETRYNLVLCKRLRKDNKDDKKDDNKKKDSKNDQSGNNEQKQDKDKSDNSQSKSQENQQQMSKENAEQMLNAAMQQELQTQQRLSKNKQQRQSRHLEKNW